MNVVSDYGRARKHRKKQLCGQYKFPVFIKFILILFTTICFLINSLTTMSKSWFGYFLLFGSKYFLIKVKKNIHHQLVAYHWWQGPLKRVNIGFLKSFKYKKNRRSHIYHKMIALMLMLMMCLEKRSRSLNIYLA